MRKLFFNLINRLLKFSVQVFFSLPFIEDHAKKNKIVRETVALYPNTGFGGLSAKIRFWDSPIEQLEKFVPKSGVIIDLGCGEGIMTNYLAKSAPQRQLIGIELNKSRTKYANRGLKNAKFIQADVLEEALPKADSIVMSHLMHHLPSFQDQMKLIQHCGSSLRQGGQLIIVEVDKQFSLKYLFTWLIDAVIVPILFDKQFFNIKVFHRSRRDWKLIIEHFDFKVERIEQVKNGPFPDIIILAKKV